MWSRSELSSLAEVSLYLYLMILRIVGWKRIFCVCVCAISVDVKQSMCFELINQLSQGSVAKFADTEGPFCFTFPDRTSSAVSCLVCSSSVYVLHDTASDTERVRTVTMQLWLSKHSVLAWRTGFIQLWLPGISSRYQLWRQQAMYNAVGCYRHLRLLLHIYRYVKRNTCFLSCTRFLTVRSLSYRTAA